MNQIYIAGPLYSTFQRDFVEKVAIEISHSIELSYPDDFFIPHLEVGLVGDISRKEIFLKDIKNIDRSLLLVAILDGQDVDSGTALEIGYAYAKNIPVYGLLTDFRAIALNKNLVIEKNEYKDINLMIWCACKYGNNIFYNLHDLKEGIKSYITNIH